MLIVLTNAKHLMKEYIDHLTLKRNIFRLESNSVHTKKKKKTNAHRISYIIWYMEFLSLSLREYYLEITNLTVTLHYGKLLRKKIKMNK